MHRHVAAIVDPYSAGALLSAEFARCGAETIAVYSTPEAPSLYASSRTYDGFSTTRRYDGDLDETARALESLGVRHLLSGCELGVELADRLAERLRLPHNAPDLRAARRDKALMTAAVSDAGLRVAETVVLTKLDDVAAWARNRLVWPVVAKPPSSTGSDTVRLCHDADELRSAHADIVARPNKLGQPSAAMVVQEYLDGPEYVVDTVSCRRRHRVAGIWSYEPIDHQRPAIGYRAMELLPAEGERQARLVGYARRVLDALGIASGPAHCELRWIHDEPVLIEVNARTSGGQCPIVARLCCGRGQIELTVESCLDPDRFLAELSRPYAMTSHGMMLFLMPEGDRPLDRVSALSALRALRSCRDLHVTLRRELPRGSVAGWVLLTHEDEGILRGDVEQIRGWERAGFPTLTQTVQAS